MDPRQRILARRAQFLLAALASSGCHEPAPPPAVAPPKPAVSAPAVAVVDSDRDGIPDEVDACPDDPGVAHADTIRNGCPFRPCLTIVQAPIEILVRIEFAAGSFAIRPMSFPILDEVASILENHPELRFDVVGHRTVSEPIGLASQRAMAVRDALVQRGVAIDRLNAVASTPPLPADAKGQSVEFRRSP